MNPTGYKYDSMSCNGSNRIHMGPKGYTLGPMRYTLGQIVIQRFLFVLTGSYHSKWLLLMVCYGFQLFAMGFHCFIRFHMGFLCLLLLHIRFDDFLSAAILLVSYIWFQCVFCEFLWAPMVSTTIGLTSSASVARAIYIHSFLLYLGDACITLPPKCILDIVCNWVNMGQINMDSLYNYKENIFVLY